MTFNTMNNNSTTCSQPYCFSKTPSYCTLDITLNEEQCTCLDPYQMNDVYYLHQTHTCELPTWWFPFMTGIYLLVTLICSGRLVRCWYRVKLISKLNEQHLHNHHHHRPSTNRHLQYILFLVLQHLIFSLLAFVSIWIQGGYYEVAPILLLLGRTTGGFALVHVNDQLLIPLPAPYALKQKLKRIRRQLFFTSMTIQSILVLVAVSICRIPSYRNTFNWILIMVITVGRAMGLIVMLNLRQQIQSIIKLLPPSSNNENNHQLLISRHSSPASRSTSSSSNPFVVAAKQMLESLGKSNIKFIFVGLVLFPWIILYCIFEQVPYFFVIFSLDALALAIVVTNTVIKFSHLLTSTHTSNSNNSKSPANTPRGDYRQQQQQQQHQSMLEFLEEEQLFGGDGSNKQEQQQQQQKISTRHDNHHQEEEICFNHVHHNNDHNSSPTTSTTNNYSFNTGQDTFSFAIPILTPRNINDVITTIKVANGIEFPIMKSITRPVAATAATATTVITPPMKSNNHNGSFDGGMTLI
jgi:hypothetical protein